MTVLRTKLSFHRCSYQAVWHQQRDADPEIDSYGEGLWNMWMIAHLTLLCVYGTISIVVSVLGITALTSFDGDNIKLDPDPNRMVSVPLCWTKDQGVFVAASVSGSGASAVSELKFQVSVSSVVQRAEIKRGGMIARHARGRCALNLGKRVNLCKFQQLPRVTGTCTMGQHHS